MRWSTRFAAVVLSAVLTACTSLPIQEMSDARQAISAARDAGAEIYANAALETAERLLDSAEAFLASGKYDRSREDAIAAHMWD